MKKIAFLQRKSTSEKILYSVVFLLFSAFALSYLYIFFWGVVATLKTHTENVLYPFAFPAKPQWKNFIEVFTLFTPKNTSFIKMTINSIYFSVVPAAGGILFCSMLSYVTTKYQFFGAKAYYYISFVVMLLPIYSSGGAMYKLIFELDLINNYLFVITAFGGLGATYMYFAAFFKNLSWSYAEAAFIDGANDWQVFFRVMFPQSLSMIGALFLLSWMGAWNSYDAQLLYLPKLPTLSVGIYLFDFDMQYYVRKDLLFAACMVSSIPTLIVFICFNKIMMSNVSLGGIKE
ncbi:MAG: carbohydrate ABC transporter permease [Clostridia bacterium]|nr:carbohydrate ABC transporter permease [Clostridia bacterium]